ncbi:MAG: hypothetical protein ACOCX0_01025 [Bacteroidota bacterium]
MKTTVKIIILVLVAGLWACEKNDPLADQGELTGRTVAFNLLAQMPDAAAGDTIALRNVSWAVDDNIETIVFRHSGFKLRSYEVKIAIEVEGETNTVYELEASLAQDSILTPSTLFATYPEEGFVLNDYYQTLENAYVINHDFIVPAGYALSTEEGPELINAMDEEVFGFFVQQFSTQLNRDMLLTIFPDLSPFSVDYFEIDDEGNFTGELTPEGIQYYIDNIDRELFNEFLDEATVEDNTRVTIESEAILEGAEEGSTSTRNFKVI